MRHLGVFITGLVLCATGSASYAQMADGRDFAIQNITRGKTAGNIYIGRQWKKGGELLKVSLNAKKNVEASSVYVRAYFYDRTGKLIQKYREPTRIQVREQYRGGMPEAFPAGKVQNVYFPILDAISSGRHRWAAAVVVFGGETEAVAAVFPSGMMRLEQLEFDEKELVIESGNLVLEEPVPGK
jgi:hypothetical protein